MARHAAQVKEVENPSSVGPRGNPGNHDNQGFKNAKQVAELTAKFKPADLIEEYGSISGAIRYLASEEYDVGAIAKFMGKRYQHVRNVLQQPLQS